jgi:hypothetical protein
MSMSRLTGVSADVSNDRADRDECLQPAAGLTSDRHTREQVLVAPEKPTTSGGRTVRGMIRGRVQGSGADLHLNWSMSSRRDLMDSVADNAD